MRAIMSCWDKTGLTDFARGLAALGWELVSTGKTQRSLQADGLTVAGIEDVTGFPEILAGRVKTLHPMVHGGILARREDQEHMHQLAELGITPVDLVVSNLYPFAETIAQSPIAFGALREAAQSSTPFMPDAVTAAVEQIDIGGPTLLRAAAKNFPDVLVLTDPADYPVVLEALQQGGKRAGTASKGNGADGTDGDSLGVPLAERARLAQKAFEHTARYDAIVAQYFAAANGMEFAESLSLPLARSLPFSYGENPHQQGMLYRLAEPRLAGPSLADMEQLAGDAVSYNNLLDLDNAYAIVADFTEPAVAIVKHNSPCGVGVGRDVAEAFRKAFAGDPLSAYGGVIAANRPITPEIAEATRGTLFWVLVAPEYDPEALRLLRRYRWVKRIFRAPVPPAAPPAEALPGFRLHYRPVLGGFLAQTHDAVPLEQITFTTVSQRPPTAAELSDLRFGWRVVKHVRSNASVFVSDGYLVASCAGQMSRIDSVLAATNVARRSESRRPDASEAQPAAGCVMATDGFFAKPDAVEAAIVAGVTAIAHPGGGKEDAEAVAVADAHHVAMVTTGFRHFRH